MPSAARPATPAPMTKTLAGRRLACRRHLAGEHPAVVLGGLDDRAVAGDVRHRGQHVHRLGPRDPRHGVERHPGDLALGKVGDVARGCAAGIIIEMRSSPGASRASWASVGRVDRGDDVRLPRGSRRRPTSRRPPRYVLVGERGLRPGALLHDDVVAEGHKLRHGLGGGGDKALAGPRLPRDCDLHPHSLASGRRAADDRLHPARYRDADRRPETPLSPTGESAGVVGESIIAADPSDDLRPSTRGGGAGRRSAPGTAGRRSVGCAVPSPTGGAGPPDRPRHPGVDQKKPSGFSS